MELGKLSQAVFLQKQTETVNNVQDVNRDYFWTVNLED